MFCSRCGKTIYPGDEKCKYCGQSVGASRFMGTADVAAYTAAQSREEAPAVERDDKDFTRTSYMSPAQEEEAPREESQDVTRRTVYRPVLRDEEAEGRTNRDTFPEPEEAPVTFKPEIAFDDFEKVDMTVVKVLECENVKKSKKLLRFTLDDGSGTPRQILSGIAQYYKPEELLGRTLVACTNLAPRKMMGLDSCGMLLSAEKDEKLTLLILDDAIPAGAKLC